MSTEVENSRPNIRIQIQNTVSDEPVEEMDVDKEENEEGEISDDTEHEISEINVETNSKEIPAAMPNFMTGINIFDRKEQEKLQERAKRFALKPEEIHSFTEQDLRDLHESLGIKSDNEAEVKFDTLQMLGINDMSAEDIIDYFANYAPDGIEWVDSNTCNVVWLDNLSAARALHFKSKPVRGMPAREPKDTFPKEFLDDIANDDGEAGQSILIKNKNREIELQNEIGEVILPKRYLKNSVDISEITVPIPPGYWRLGEPYPKTKCLLLRYSLVSDKLPYKSEKCNKYFKKLPYQRNVISDSKKKELRTIFERNKELDKNPWASLAKNWDRDVKFREREPVIYNLMEDEDDDEVKPVIEVKNPKLLARLGTKRKIEESVEDNEDKAINSSTEKQETKLPRMKMYADEEEEKMKRKKLLNKLKKQADKIEKTPNEMDLRSILVPTHRLLSKSQSSEIDQSDLGQRLKNRNKKMVFAIERDLFNQQSISEREERNLKPERSSYRDKSDRMMEHEKDRRRTVISRLQTDSTHRSLPKLGRRTLHSDQIKSHLYKRSRRDRSPSEDRYGHQKPKSKVAVVIKTQKRPVVASTIWSRVKRPSESEQSSAESESESQESEKSESSSSSSSESESESDDSEEGSDSSSMNYKKSKKVDRPGFKSAELLRRLGHKSPLKITMSNDRYRNKK